MTTRCFNFGNACCALFAALLFSGCASRGDKETFSEVPIVEGQPAEQTPASIQKAQEIVRTTPTQPVATPTSDGSVEAYKKARGEFQAAEEAALKRQRGMDSVQRDLDKLTEQKQTWQREIVYAKGRSAVAKEKLNRALAVGDQAQIEKFRTEAENWDTRQKAAVMELERTNLEIHDTVQALQDSFKTTEKNLVLPGESLDIFIKEDDTLNGPYQVRQGGYILMKNIGRIDVAGKDLRGAEQAIRDALAENYIKNATVLVDRPDASIGNSGAVIYFAGEFKKPGAWQIPAGLSPTIVTALLRSDGYKETADLTKVKLLRLVNGQALVEEINVQAILHGGGLPSDVALKPGDIIMIPAFANVVYVTGNVVRPGALKLLPDDELTAYSAILRSGGFARFAKRSGVYVLRDKGNGAKEKIPVNISDLQGGDGSDIVLRSKDIVVVPEKFFSF